MWLPSQSIVSTQVEAALERVAEAREVGAAEARALPARRSRCRRGSLAARRLDEIAGAVGAGVVDDEHLEPRILREHAARDREHVSRLVVGGQDDDSARMRERAGYREGFR